MVKQYSNACVGYTFLVVLALGAYIAAIVLVDVSGRSGDSFNEGEFFAGWVLAATMTLILYVGSYFYFRRVAQRGRKIIDALLNNDSATNRAHRVVTYDYLRELQRYAPIFITMTFLLFTYSLWLIFELKKWTSWLGGFMLVLVLFMALYLGLRHLRHSLEIIQAEASNSETKLWTAVKSTVDEHDVTKLSL